MPGPPPSSRPRGRGQFACHIWWRNCFFLRTTSAPSIKAMIIFSMSNLPRSETWREGKNNQHHRWALPVPTYSPKLTLPPNLYCYLQSLDTPRVTQVRSTDCNYHHLNSSFLFLSPFSLFSKMPRWIFAEDRRYKAQLRGRQGLPGDFRTQRTPWDTRGRKGRGKPASGVGAEGHWWLIHPPSCRLGGLGSRRSVKLRMYAGMCYMSKSLVLHERWKAPERGLFFVSGRVELTTVKVLICTGFVPSCVLTIRGRRRGPRTG